jgi:type I restriction enzyme, S subunit
MTKNTNCQDIAPQRVNDFRIEKLIAELCPEGVEWKTLGEIGKVSMCKRIFKNETLLSDAIPFYKIGTFGKQPNAFIPKELFDEYREKYSFPQKGDVLLSASGSIGRRVIYNGEPAYFQDSNIIWIDNDESKVLNKFLYYLYEIIEWKTEGGTIQRLYNDNLKKMSIPTPPLAIQQEIVKILDTFTKLEAELEAELEAREKQYEYYRDELLTFGDDVEWKALGEIYEFQYGEGNTIPTSGGEYPVYGSNGIVGSHSKYNSEDAPVIGHIGAYAGIVNWASGKHFVTYNGVICRIKKSVNPRFGYHLLKKQNLRALAKDGSQPFVSYDKLKSVKVQVPKNDKQIEIASILDKFDALVNDISVGLPAELKARRKQYEYYRNKLLTFKPLEEAHAKQ